MGERTEQLIADLAQAISNQIGEAKAAMQTQLAESLRGVLLKGARPVPVGPFTLGNTAGDHMLAYGPGVIVGLAVRETLNASNIAFVLHDGHDAGGPEICSGKVTAGSTIMGPLAAPGGVSFSEGLFVEIVSGTGTLGGAVYMRGSE